MSGKDWRRKLTDADYAEIRRRYKVLFHSQTRLASDFGVDQSTVSRVLSGEFGR